MTDTCENCGARIVMQIFKGTGVCCEYCRKERDGEGLRVPRRRPPEPLTDMPG